jgi:hypothetical protein
VTSIVAAQTPRSPATRPARVYVKTILSLALVLRLTVMAMVLFTYQRDWLFSKAPDLGFLAFALSSGHGLSSPFGGSTGPTAFLAPGYPAVLALVFRIFGSYSIASSAAIMGLQCLFALLTIAAMMYVARQIFGAPVANVAGAFWAVSLPLLWLPAILWDTSLSTLLLTGMVALATRVVNEPCKNGWVFMGAYCGLAMLVNPSLTLALFAILGWTVYQIRLVSGYRVRYKPWLCLLGLLCVFAPWPLRNARVLHAFIPLRSNFGYEVWQGNHNGANGMFDATLEPLQNKQEYAEYARNGEVAYMSNKATLARVYIRSHPADFARISAERAVRFWTGAGSITNSGVVELHAVITSLLGLAGLAAIFQRHRPVAMLFLLPLLVFPLPYYITHPDFRFRLVLDPLLTILGAYAVVRMWTYWKSEHQP